MLRSRTSGNRTIKAWREDVIDEWARNLPTATPEIAPIVAAGNVYRQSKEYEQRRRLGLLSKKKQTNKLKKRVDTEARV
jgi:hypothetical protein